MFKNTDGVNHSYHPNIITLALIRLAVKTQPTGEELYIVSVPFCGWNTRNRLKHADLRCFVLFQVFHFFERNTWND